MRLTLLLSFILWTYAANAQSTAETEIAQLEMFLASTQRDSVKVYAQKLLDENGSQANSIVAIAEYYLAEGVLYENPEEAKRLSQRALEKFLAADQLVYAARSHKSLGNALKLLYSYDEALINFEQALGLLNKAADPKADQLKAIIHYGIGATLREKSEYQNAIKSLQRADSIAGILADTTVRVSALIQIAAIFFEIEDLDKSTRYFQDAMTLADNPRQIGMQYFILNGLAHVYREKNQLDSALFLFQEAYFKSKKRNDDVNAAVYLFNIADLLMLQGRMDTAQVANIEMMKISNELNLKENLAFGHELNSRYYLSKGQRGLALENAEISVELSKEIGDPEQLVRSLKNLYEVRSSFGLHKEALAAYQQFDHLEDSLLSIQNLQSIAEIETRYETQKKDLEIVDLTQRNQIQELQLSQRNLLLIGMAFTFVFILVSGYLIYTRNTLKRKQEAESLKQKMLRIQLNPHFMFNSLNAIQSLVYQESDRQRAADCLSMFSSLMRNILELNQHNFISLEEELEFIQEYLEIQQIRFDDLITYDLNVDEQLELHQVLIPPMITQPFIENALEHGFPDKSQNCELSIAFQKKGQFLEIDISDNGIGREEAAKQEDGIPHRSMATEITKDRLAVLGKSLSRNASMIIDDRLEGSDVIGTQVIFKLPLIYE